MARTAKLSGAGYRRVLLTIALGAVAIGQHSRTQGPLSRPLVAFTSPQHGASGVSRDIFVSADVTIPNGRIDEETLTSNNVYLHRSLDGTRIPAVLNTSGAGDVIVLRPEALLEAETDYTFVVTDGLKDIAGAGFVPFSMNFATGTGSGTTDTSVAFEKIMLPAGITRGEQFTAVTIGPDRKLYAAELYGTINRYTINADGTLSNPQRIVALQTAHGGLQRNIMGMEFDPASTADNLILYVSHSTRWTVPPPPNWGGKISRMSGPDLATVTDIVVNLPRAASDHLTNQLDFGPDGALYFVQGSMNAMGGPDAAWDFRHEVLLSAAVLRVDLTAFTPPLDVKTSDGGTYNPFAPGAPLTIYASGLRNSYDLVWHRNGHLYIPNNGSTGGGNTPATPVPFAGAYLPRMDQATHGPYNGPEVPGIIGVPQSINDHLFDIVRGGYYGHPNPSRREYVLMGGNPTDGIDLAEVDAYPVGTQPDRNYRGFAFDFGVHQSANGILEYKSGVFGGALTGKLLVVRFSGGDDIIVLTPGATGNIIQSQTGIVGFTGFDDPLDIVEDTATGNIYLAVFGELRLYLLRPVSIPDRPALLETDAVSSSQIDLTWSDNSENEVGFRIERSTNGVDFSQIATVGANITAFSHTGLTAATTYTYRVRSYNAAGASQPSPSATETTNDDIPGEPPTVTLVTPAPGTEFLSPGAITLEATADDIDGAIAQVAFFAGATPVGTAATAPYTVVWKAPAPGAYSLTARATDDSGETTTSAAINVRINAPPSVQLTAPAAGATFVAPPSVTLRATAGDSDGQVSTVEFFVGSTMVGSDSASPYEAVWSGPTPNTYQVHARALDDKGAMTTSNTVQVRIDPLPTVSLARPGSGETWLGGTPQQIQWSYTGTPGNVKIELFKGGALNRVIASSVAIGTSGAGSYNWTVPVTQPSGNDYSVRVSSTINPAIADPSDTFTIVGPAIAVSGPNGGESWLGSTSQQIRWSYTGAPGPNVRIDLLKNGVLNRTINASAPIGSGGTGQLSWTIPPTQAGGTDYRVRITSTSNASVIDVSNANFTILTPTIAIQTPNGGESILGGMPQQIRWSYSGAPGPHVKIELLKNGSLKRVITSSTSIGSGGAGSFNWTVLPGEMAGGDYRVRVTSTGTSTVFDTSDANFAIATPTFTIESANGGESLPAGLPHQIRWSYTGVPGPSVKIDLLKNGVVRRVISYGTPIGTAGSGSFNWPILANELAGADYRLRVTSTSVAAATDTSNNNFSILAPVITVTAPNGGETWARGSQHTIQWTYTGLPGASVRVELLKNGGLNRTIASSVAIGSSGNGSIAWLVPAAQLPGTDYSIRVTSTAVSTVKGTSAATFSISP